MREQFPEITVKRVWEGMESFPLCPGENTFCRSKITCRQVRLMLQLSCSVVLQHHKPQLKSVWRSVEVNHLRFCCKEHFDQLLYLERPRLSRA